MARGATALNSLRPKKDGADLVAESVNISAAVTVGAGLKLLRITGEKIHIASSDLPAVLLRPGVGTRPAP